MPTHAARRSALRFLAMTPHRIRTRPPRGAADSSGVTCDPDALASVREDAAHYHGGHAAALAAPRTEADVAAIVRAAARVLPIGAQSSLTGGATPFGDVVLGTSRLNQIERIDATRVTAGAGVAIATLQDELRARGLYYPPVPTYNGAFLGGTVATNAAGAATFKYGSTRQWVEGITVVLASGEVLDIERGAHRANADGCFEIETASGAVCVPIPSYRMPQVPKRSAGYHAEPGMDLIDLFIGSEGTLGIVTEISVRVMPAPAGACMAMIPVTSEARGLELVASLRRSSQETWLTRDPDGVDVAAIEHVDRRSLELLREDGEDRRHGIAVPPGTALVLLVQIELPSSTDAASAYDQIASLTRDGTPRTALQRFCRVLQEAGAFDTAELALPGDRRRAEQFLAFREAVPSAVKHRVAHGKAQIDERIEKTAADMIVPFERFADMMAIYRSGFERRGLDYAMWGHISDGNVHPNVVPRSYADVVAGREAILEFGREVKRLGGCPLAEHGVGRSAVKQALLRDLYGAEGIEEMRAVKRALDPEWKLAPGVLFDR
jgi:D-lactate dehydrogenase (cytochrome)